MKLFILFKLVSPKNKEHAFYFFRYFSSSCGKITKKCVNGKQMVGNIDKSFSVRRFFRIFVANLFKHIAHGKRLKQRHSDGCLLSCGDCRARSHGGAGNRLVLPASTLRLSVSAHHPVLSGLLPGGSPDRAGCAARREAVGVEELVFAFDIARRAGCGVDLVYEDGGQEIKR